MYAIVDELDEPFSVNIDFDVVELHDGLVPLHDSSHPTLAEYVPLGPAELWYRYMPESSNWHRGTSTRWTVALSAATKAQRVTGTSKDETPGDGCG